MSAPREEAVRCAGVEVAFGEGEARVSALRGADFAAAEGEMTLLVGPSGCGKTTLITVMAGMLRPGAGTVEIFGAQPGRMSEAERVAFRRRRLGFVFQQFNLIAAFTAAENVAVPLLAQGMPRRVALDRARAMLADLGLDGRAEASPRQLSGGQQQRVALARALVHEPSLVICDEPTSALDQRAGEGVMTLLARAAVQPGRAVIVVTHDARTFRFADRIAHMEDGAVTRVERLAESRTPLFSS